MYLFSDPVSNISNRADRGNDLLASEAVADRAH
jgi:hypothetical protein